MSKPTKTPIRNLVVISDTHFGCQVALCPPNPIHMDEGGTYTPSAFQQKLYSYWEHFWCEVVPKVTKKEPFILVHNGDITDGTHHGSVTQISQNLTTQKTIAMEVMPKIIKTQKVCEYYHIRGTEAHVGQSGQVEEDIAQSLGAKPNSEGQYARYGLRLYLGANKLLLDFAHHIGTTGSTAYETTAVMKELAEAYLEAARWGERPPDLVVRSHRHRCIGIEMPTANIWARSWTTPGWQGKTPFAYRIAGARQALPQFGGLIIREAPDKEWYVRPAVYTIKNNTPEGDENYNA